MNAPSKGRERRWLSVTAATSLIPGRRTEVEAWLRAQGLVVKLPFGPVAVDIEAAYERITLLSTPVDGAAAAQPAPASPADDPEAPTPEPSRPAARRRRPATPPRGPTTLARERI